MINIIITEFQKLTYTVSWLQRAQKRGAVTPLMLSLLVIFSELAHLPYCQFSTHVTRFFLSWAG